MILPYIWYWDSEEEVIHFTQLITKSHKLDLPKSEGIWKPQNFKMSLIELQRMNIWRESQISSFI